MLIELTKQLDVLTETLQLVSNVTGQIEPGQKVELDVISRAPNLFATVNVLGNPVVGGVAQLLTQVPVEIQVKWIVRMDKTH